MPVMAMARDNSQDEGNRQDKDNGQDQDKDGC
jgi:hypothetical protein